MFTARFYCLQLWNIKIQSMSTKSKISHLDDYDLLIWIFEQELPWREELFKLSNAKSLSLMGLVKFVRNNYETIKQLENEKTRTNRKA
jgi:hypothetical protein